ncbi:MAG: UvrB/UvrC motif-containing protein [Candidatus Omnitrophota bacterium]
MVCDVCGKNQATVHLTEIVDEQMSELHLCEECARQKSAKMEQQFGLADLLAGLSDFQKPAEEKEIISLKCPECGLMYKDFKKLGRLGCGECYSTFRKYLAPLLKKIHGSNTHLGKSPVKMPKAAKEKNNLQDLRFMLQKAIQREAYEEAAQIRDQIKKLQEKQSKDTSD